jgi:SAM-dependent methyltransferase
VCRRLFPQKGCRFLAPYHDLELSIALDCHDKRHCLPVVGPTGRVLDIGCGRGQTLVALRIPPYRGFGVDPDAEAISHPLGEHTLLVASAEFLPFPPGFFNTVYSRVSLPYTNIPVALREIFLVLERGGSLWLLLHSWSMLKARAKSSFRHRNLKDLLYCIYIVLNSIALRGGFQLRWIFGGYESVQSDFSITRALRRAGFSNIHVSEPPFFIVTAKKP